MKILSWNVNGIRAALNKGFADWVKQTKADVICIQETKADLSKIPDTIRNLDHYNTFWHSCTSRSGYSGVGILSRIKPESVNEKLGIEEFDVEGRVLELDFGSFILYNIYFPNGGAENKRVPFKLRFYDAVLHRSAKQRRNGKGIVICGDYNIAHKEIDLARPKENIKTTGFLPEERAKLDEMVNDGWIDSFREYHPDEPQQYSYWDTFTRARERNVGWRIDYHWITPEMRPALKNAWISPEVMGSDHCPVGIVINP
ncbi:MAG: exodeoxyribonuclease III [Ignavibacteria bacterium]|nr:exodeoxyribonuclease III [Ignavibacteria bacterium]